MHSLYAALRRLREQHGWTQQYVADHLQISTPAYSKIECGVTDVNYSRIAKIAALYGISIIELFAHGMTMSEASGKIEIDTITKLLDEREKEVDFLQQKLDELRMELKHINEKNS